MARYTKDKSKIIIDGNTKTLFHCGYDTSGGEKALGVFSEPYGYQHMGDFRRRPIYVTDTEISVPSWTRRQKVSLSRQMFGQMATLDFSLELISDWAIGEHYDVLYKGTDKTFGNAFEDYVNNTWANSCSVKGSTYNLKTLLKLIIQERIRDGDLLQVYEYSSRSGLPQLRYIKSHRVYERDGVSEIQDGRYSGYAVQDGVIKNAAGLPIAYYIQDPLSKDDDRIINAKDCVLIYRPAFLDKDRGIPPITSGLLEALSIQELDDAYQRRLKVEALIVLKRFNKAGEALPNNVAQNWITEEDTGNGVAPVLIPPGTEQVGGINYIEWQQGDITTLSSTTPNIEATEYKDVLETRLLSCIGVPHQLIYSPTDISRAPARGISDIFRKTISKNQQIVEQFIKPAIVWAIGNIIGSGILPNTKEKWWNYIDFTRPPKFTLDAFNEGKQRLEYFKMGMDTRDSITTSQFGRRGVDVLAERKQEVIEVLSTAIDIKQELLNKYKGDNEATKMISELDITQLHNNLELLTPNGITKPPVPPVNNTDVQDNANPENN